MKKTQLLEPDSEATEIQKVACDLIATKDLAVYNIGLLFQLIMFLTITDCFLISFDIISFRMFKEVLLCVNVVGLLSMYFLYKKNAKTTDGLVQTLRLYRRLLLDRKQKIEYLQEGDK